MKVSVKTLTITAVLSAFALLSFMLEGIIPPIFIPGARLGLSNLFVLLALIILGTKSAFAVFIVKIILGSIFAGNISMIMYSLPSGIISLAFEVLLIKFWGNKLSLVAISTGAAVINVAIQNFVYVLITNTPSLMVYLPYLVLISVCSGAFVGIVCQIIIKILPITFTKDKV